MEKIETGIFGERLIGKTIKYARIRGFDVEIEFTDGSTFEYDASDGGYSTWRLIKEDKEGDADADSD